MHITLLVPIPPSTKKPTLQEAAYFDPLIIDLSIAKLTCPVCSERVHFVCRKIESGKEIKFFSHLPLKGPPPDPESLCPLRSASLNKTNLTQMAKAAEKTMVHLGKFKFYLNKVFGYDEKLSDSQEFQDENRIENLCRDMNSNWYKKDGIKTAFCFQSIEEMLSLFSMFVPILKEQIPYLKVRNHIYTYEPRHRNNTILIWKCLHLFREKSNLMALIKTSLLFLKTHSIEIGKAFKKGNSIEDVIIFWSFGLLFMMPWDELLLSKTKK